MQKTLKKIFPFAVSLLLHLGVVVLLTWQLKPEAWAPLGVHKKGSSAAEIVEIKISSPVPVSKNFSVISPSVSQEGDVAVTQKKAQPAQPQDLGHANGIVSEGHLGESKGAVASAKERYLYELHVLIEERKVYPMMSRRLREAGRVLIQFIVTKDGEIQDVTVKEGTSYPRLNEAARDLVAGIKKYKPLPADLVEDNAKLEISIEYTLK